MLGLSGSEIVGEDSRGLDGLEMVAAAGMEEGRIRYKPRVSENERRVVRSAAERGLAQYISLLLKAVFMKSWESRVGSVEIR